MPEQRPRQRNQARSWKVLCVLGWILFPITALVQPAAGQDAPVPGWIGFVEESIAVSERDGLATIWVAWEVLTPGPSTVGYTSVADTAAAGSDYTEVGGTLAFGGETTWGIRTFDVPIIDDAEAEGPERLLVTLHDPIGAALAGSATLTLEILDDDQVPAGGALAFATAYSEQPETGGAITVRVERRDGSQGAVSAVCVVTGGSAEPEVDYRFSPTTLNWADGETGVRTVTVEILDDGKYEGWEGIELGFRSVTGATLYSPSRTTVLIEDDEYVAPGPYIPPIDQDGMLGGFSGVSCFIGSLL